MAEHGVGKWWARPALLIPAGLLLAAVAVQGVEVFRETPQPKPSHLAAHVPSVLPGWTVRDVPLGPNEFLEEQVGRILNFDEFVYREFSRPGQTFGIYVAYWGAGKMPTRLVASHTPDRCWTENGWTCLEMRFRETHHVNGIELQPAEWRLFKSPTGEPTYVWFWHLIEGRAYNYGERFNAVPHPLQWWRDAVQQAMFGSREQYFIRVTSNVPFERLRGDPGFEAALAGLAELGLAVAPEES